MAFDFNLPVTTSNHSTVFVPAIRDGWLALGTGLDPTYAGTLSNIPTGTKRWTAGKVQQWNGSAWADYVTIWAPLASPALTGNPTAPTQSVGNNSTRIATTAFVVSMKANTVPVANGTAAIGALNRWAAADHIHPTDTTRASTASPTFTGTPAAPTAAADTSTTQLATTAFVTNQASSTAPAANGTAAAGTSKRYSRQDHVHPTDTTRAPVASPAFTGTGTYNGLEIGTRRVPINLASGTYTLTAADVAKCVARDSSVTIPSGVFSAGDPIIVYNNDTVTNSLIAAGGTTVILAGIGSTGTRSMAPRALVSILCVAPNTFVVSGAGLT